MDKIKEREEINFKKKNTTYQLPSGPWKYNKGHKSSVNALLLQCWVSPTKDIQVPVSVV